VSNKLKLSLKNQTTEMNVEVEDLNDHQTNLMINNMFAVFGVPEAAAPNPWVKYMDQPNTEAAPTIEMEEDVEVDYVVVDTPPAPVTKPVPVTKKPDAPKPQGVSRKLPIINQNERSSFTIADNPKFAHLVNAATEIAEHTPKAQTKIDATNDHLKTGIKIEDVNGVPTQLYRARCDCPKCGWKGNRYVKDNNFYAKCFGCKIKLAVIPATNRAMIPDEWNNYFHAHEEYIDLRSDTGVRK